MTTPAETPAAPPKHTLSSRVLRVVWILAGLYVFLLVLGLGLSTWTAEPSMCASCHEMEHSVATWQTSPHANAGCPACHEPVRPWYRFPETFLFRGQMLRRDLNTHNANPDMLTMPASVVALRPIPDENCLQCHDLSRAVTLPATLTMDHAKHVARNKSCVSCHKWTAHPPPASEAPLLLMQQCFNCHGRKLGAKAPGTCTLCHPKSLPAKPASHANTTSWLAQHGKAAKANRLPCGMCHDDSFCRNCHGLDMPHPAGWVKDGPVTHSQFAKTNSQVCVQCHGPQLALCSMCHHRGLSLTNKPWASNHAPTVDQRGAAFCFTCHDGVFCNTCHGRPGGPTGSSTVSPN